MKENRRIIVLLDVDGVINVDHPSSTWGTVVSHGTARAENRDWSMKWSPALTKWIKDFHKTGLVEFQWCTTWCSYADQLEKLFDLPKFPRAISDENMDTASHSDVMWLKHAAALKVLADGDTLVWIDDNAIPRMGQRYDELVATNKSLLVRPSAYTGITVGDTEAITQFVHRMMSR